MNKDEVIASLRRAVEDSGQAENVLQLVVHGSFLKYDMPNDIDLVLVVREMTPEIHDLMSRIRGCAPVPVDMYFYPIDELLGGVSFLEREFVLEYFGAGIVVYGSNIFKALYGNVTREQYEHSMLVRNIEYLQNTRKKYCSNTPNAEKVAYLKKYLTRICRSIVMLDTGLPHSIVSMMHKDKVFMQVAKILDGVKAEHFTQACNDDDATGIYNAINTVAKYFIKFRSAK